jgi:predicted peroxiredoxin
MSKKKLLFVMSGADPDKPDTCNAPLFQATVAAALSHDVEVIFTGISGTLTLPGVAENIEVNIESHQTLYDVIREAYNAGVSFKACNTCHASLQMAGQEMIEEIEEKVGAAYVIHEALQDDTVVFTY